MLGMLRAALYTRVSTKHQTDKHGTRYQREALATMATQRGWKVAGIFTDEGFSGRKERRPGLDALMLACERREVDVVAVWRFDRFARSLSHLVASLNRFQKLGVQFVSHQEGLDTSTPIGMAMFQIAGAMAELESNLGRERVAAGIASAKARGVHCGRPWHPMTQEEAVALYTKHGSYRLAGIAAGCSASVIYKRAHGVFPPSHPDTEEEEEEG